MKYCVGIAVLATLIPGFAFAQTVTIETTLRERGYPEGVILQGQASANVYIPLPNTAKLGNGRIVVEGRTLTPTLQRGSMTIEANGQPVDAFAPERDNQPVMIQRTVEIDDAALNRAEALNVRFDADFRASTDPCTDDLDTGNSAVLFAGTRVAYDVRLDDIRSIADAIAILPHRSPIVLPDTLNVESDVAAAAIQLGTLMVLRGNNPHFGSKRGDDPVAIRIESIVPSAARRPGIRLERADGRLDIVVDTGVDFAALGRLLQSAPAALSGDRIEVASAEERCGADISQFQEFAALPPVQRVRRFGEWRLNFPLVTGSGLLSDTALLKLFLAPDWSDERAIVTIYLNEQIVAALRPNTGENNIRVPLPPSLLRFSNTLRVAIERGGGTQYCAATDRGQAAQLLPGSGLHLRDDIGTGFLRFAAGFAKGGEIALPPDAARQQTIAPYLQLASRILASFSARTGPLSVVFGVPSGIDSSGVLHFETVGQTGLIVAAADQIDRRDIRVTTTSPIAVLTAESDQRTLRVQLADARNIPAPTSLYLGGGTKAIVADTGVVWQDGARVLGPTFAERMQDRVDDAFSRQLVTWVLIAIAVVILILVSRAVIKSIFRSRRRADKG